MAIQVKNVHAVEQVEQSGVCGVCADATDKQSGSQSEPFHYGFLLDSFRDYVRLREELLMVLRAVARDDNQRESNAHTDKVGNTCRFIGIANLGSRHKMQRSDSRPEYQDGPADCDGSSGRC